MKAAKDFDDGHYKDVPQHAIRAFGRAYSAWAYGQAVCACLLGERCSFDPKHSGSDNTFTPSTACK